MNEVSKKISRNIGILKKLQLIVPNVGRVGVCSIRMSGRAFPVMYASFIGLS